MGIPPMPFDTKRGIFFLDSRSLAQLGLAGSYPAAATRQNVALGGAEFQWIFRD